MAPSDTPDGQGPDDRAVFAAEIALGLAARGTPPNGGHGPAPDPALDAAVARWEHDFASLADTLAPVPPPPAVWAAVAAAVAHPAVSAAGPAARPAAGSLMLWRGLAAAAVAAAALAWLLPRPVPVATFPGPPAAPAAAPAPQPLLISTLRDRDGTPAYVVAYQTARGTLLVVPVASPPPPGRTARLWLVSSGQPRTALASLDPAGVTMVTLPGAAAGAADPRATLVVTLEPAGLPLQSASDGVVTAHGGFAAY